MKAFLHPVLRVLVIQALSIQLFCSSALACPEIGGIPDFNCDGDLVISVMGDSIPYGFGDTKNGNKGGYVLRASKKLPKATFVNLAKAGERTFELINLLNGAFNKGKNEAVRSALIESDIVILDVGRNDRWLFGEPPATYRNLKRAVSLIKHGVTDAGEVAPIIVTAVMMLPNRGSQGPWVKALNALILKGNSTANPADLRFDLVSKRLLSTDQIHPTVQGYDALAKTLVSYLSKNLPKKMRKLHPPDAAETPAA